MAYGCIAAVQNGKGEMMFDINTYQILDSRWEIDRGAVVFCPECQRQMFVAYNQAYEGELWTCFCGCSYNAIPGGYRETFTVTWGWSGPAVPKEQWEQWIRDRTSL
jgi:hypothetical protein